MKNLNELRDRVYEINKANGWHIEGQKRDFIDDINLIHSEISEAYEDYRSGHAVNKVWYEYKVGGEIIKSKAYKVNGKLGKPCGIPSELADVIIRILDTDKLHELEIAENYTRIYLETSLGFSYKLKFNELISILHQHAESKLTHQATAAKLAFMIYLIVDFCKENCINLEEIIEQKLAYNATRGERHGGKVI